jgi:nucleoside-diphosphate-sugar epimerase
VRIFFAGASGVIGRHLLPLLVEGGHEVTALTRTPGKADALREAGAIPVLADALDAEALREAVVAARPEAVIHHLTDLPLQIDPKRLEEAYAANDRIRREGTQNLVRAAVAAGARRIVAQAVAFGYRPEGGWVKSEQDPLFVDAPPPFDGAIEAMRALERSVLESDGIEGVVLRFGFWYGPGTAYARDGSTAAQVLARRFPVVGSGAGTFSFVHVDDVARATIAALERGDPGIYNVVDDDPAPAHEWLPTYARALGAKRPLRVPRFLARWIAGPFAVFLMTELRGASNARAKRELGWEPRWRSWRDGFREALG